MEMMIVVIAMQAVLYFTMDPMKGTADIMTPEQVPSDVPTEAEVQTELESRVPNGATILP